MGQGDQLQEMEAAGVNNPAWERVVSVGRTSTASKPLQAQGLSEAVTGMKHSEECHLLTSP